MDSILIALRAVEWRIPRLAGENARLRDDHQNADLLAADGCATFLFLMATAPQNPPKPGPGPLYCPNCAKEVTDPLTCGDCSAVICRTCGTPLESPDELGIG